MTNKELQEQNTRYAKTIEQQDKDIANLEERLALAEQQILRWNLIDAKTPEAVSSLLLLKTKEASKYHNKFVTLRETLKSLIALIETSE